MSAHQLLLLLAASNPDEVYETLTGMQIIERDWPLVAGFIASMTRALKIFAILSVFQAVLPLLGRQKLAIFSKDFWVDLLYYWFLSAFVGTPFFAAGDMIGHAVFSGIPSLVPAAARLPFAVQVFIGIWAFDFIVYWRHRLEHKLPVLWWFHAVHHTPTVITPLTTFRLHPVEGAIGGFLNSMVYIIGFRNSAMALAFTIYLSWNYFIHTGIKLPYQRYLQKIFVTPMHHFWHHAVDPEAQGKNLGVVFAWNDRLFGTEYLPGHAPSTFGIPDDPFIDRAGPLTHLFSPVQKAGLWALRAFKKLRKPEAVPSATGASAGERRS